MQPTEVKAKPILKEFKQSIIDAEILSLREEYDYWYGQYRASYTSSTEETIAYNKAYRLFRQLSELENARYRK
jgi:hypothetical protein